MEQIKYMEVLKQCKDNRPSLHLGKKDRKGIYDTSSKTMIFATKIIHDYSADNTSSKIIPSPDYIQHLPETIVELGMN